MTKRLIILLFLAWVAVTAACGDDDAPVVPGGSTIAGNATAVEPSDVPVAINVGVVVPISGAFAGGGAQVERGYRYAVDAINAAGGVFVEQYGVSLPLNLIIRDDESDPNKTTSIMEELADDDIAAYLGGFGSPLHAAGTAIAEKNAIPYLGVATALQDLHERGYRYYFSPFPKSPDVSASVYEMLNEIIPESERPTRVGIFQETTDWGNELGAMWAAEAPNYGYEIVLHETYAPLTADFTDLILKAQQADVQALLSLPIPPDGFTMYKQMGELGWKPAFSLVVRAADVPTWNDLGDIGNGVTLITGWHPALGYPGIEAMNRRHIEEVGRAADPIVGGSYSLIEVLADSIERAGSLDHAAIRDALAATDMMTVAGLVTFRPDGTSPINLALMQRIDGTVELVWPADRATAEFLYPAN